MSLLVDISCPECGRTDTVRKVGLDLYRCTECDHEFSQEDILPDDR